MCVCVFVCVWCRVASASVCRPDSRRRKFDRIGSRSRSRRRYPVTAVSSASRVDRSAVYPYARSTGAGWCRAREVNSSWSLFAGTPLRRRTSGRGSACIHLHTRCVISIVIIAISVLKRTRGRTGRGTIGHGAPGNAARRVFVRRVTAIIHALSAGVPVVYAFSDGSIVSENRFSVFVFVFDFDIDFRIGGPRCSDVRGYVPYRRRISDFETPGVGCSCPRPP